MTTQTTTGAYAMSDALWVEVAPQARDVDLAERRATSRCAAALAVLLVLAAAVYLSGVVGGRLGTTGGSGGDADAQTRSGHWEANVVNDGWFALEFASSRGELSGVEVTNVRLDPERLPAGTKGALRLDFLVSDCTTALTALGRDGTYGTYGSDRGDTRLTVTTRGPFGTTATKPLDSFGELIGDMVALVCGQTNERAAAS